MRGWIGFDCDVLDFCINLICENGGKCKFIIYLNNLILILYGNRINIIYNVIVFCSCFKGWKGDQCSIDINECLKNDICYGYGICNNSVGGFLCDCFNGFIGLKCEINIDECLLSLCFNNVICIDRIGDFSCLCFFYFDGERCEKDVDECQYFVCGFYGFCRNMFGNYSCMCELNWVGCYCEVYVSFCFV